MKLVKEHLHPKPSCIVQRFQFNSRSMRESESVAEFVADLRRLSTNCEYGETLNQMLKDRLVCGVNSEKIQRRLLQEATLTFDEALRLARAIETAEKNTVELQQGSEQSQPSGEEQIHRTQRDRDKAVKSKSPPPPEQSCSQQENSNCQPTSESEPISTESIHPEDESCLQPPLKVSHQDNDGQFQKSCSQQENSNCQSTSEPEPISTESVQPEDESCLHPPSNAPRQDNDGQVQTSEKPQQSDQQQLLAGAG